MDRIEKVFADSVAVHKISDVEVGCFLSSGVDSSYVSTFFPGQNTFTVGFDFGEKYNEISWAKELSEQIGREAPCESDSQRRILGAILKKCSTTWTSPWRTRRALRCTLYPSSPANT